MLDELYDDRWSAGVRTEAGVSDVLGVIGDFESPTAAGDDKARVSSLSAGLARPSLASFLADEVGRRRKTDFHEGVLGAVGD